MRPSRAARASRPRGNGPRRPAAHCRSARLPRRSSGCRAASIPARSRRYRHGGRARRRRPTAGVVIAVEDRHDHGDVGQMRAAAIGIVQHIDVAAAACRARRAPSPRASMIVRMLSPIEPRWTGMCGALAISAPSRVEQGAGEIEPLLDVDRGRGVLQRDAHLLGDRHEQVVEHLEHRTGSTSVPIGVARSRGTARVRISVAVARHARRASRVRRRWSRRGR